MGYYSSFLQDAFRENSITLDFEGFADSTGLTTQYSGVTFSNAIILTAGNSLNEFEFPPHSGVNVVSDHFGPISISFLSPVLAFSGYFTYAEPLTLQAFNASNSVIASGSSAFSNNEALSGVPGSSPNEYLQVAFAGGISGIAITGDTGGGSFVLDDETITRSSNVPEPSSQCLLLWGCVILVALRTRKLS